MLNIRLARLATTALLAAVPATLGMATAHADGPTSPTPVTACGTAITAPGSYALTANLGPCTSDGVDIESSGVTLDLAGFTITGPGAATTTALGISVPGSGTTGVSITSSVSGGGVTAFGTGVSVSGTSSWGVAVTGVTASGNGDGVDILNSAHAPLVQNVTASTETGTGILVSGTVDNAVVTGNTASGDTTGIDVEDSFATELLGNTVTGNGTGIVNGPVVLALVPTGGGTSAENNVATGNTVLDINEEAPGCIGDVWLDDTFGTASQSCVQ